MRIIRAALVATALIAFAAATCPAEVNWSDASWQATLATAKSENKNVFVDFYTTWCGPCKRLDQVTYTDAKVEAFLNSMIAVKYDAEKGVGEELAAQYRVHMYPTLIVIGPDGKEIDRHLGFLPADDFMAKIKGYTEGVGTVAFYTKKLGEDPDDVQTLFELGMKHADAVHADEATTALDRVLALDPNDELGHRADVIYSLGDVNYTSEHYADAKKYFEQLISEYPTGESYEQGLTRLAAAEYKLGHADDAVAVYKKYADLHPEDPRALNGFAWFCSQRKIGLDQALPAAIKAAQLSNRDPGILDTLAEVYFARGEYDDAIRIGKEALAKESDDSYFKDQVKKYEAAKADAEKQVRK